MYMLICICICACIGTCVCIYRWLIISALPNRDSPMYESIGFYLCLLRLSGSCHFKNLTILYWMLKCTSIRMLWSSWFYALIKRNVVLEIYPLELLQHAVQENHIFFRMDQLYLVFIHVVSLNLLSIAIYTFQKNDLFLQLQNVKDEMSKEQAGKEVCLTYLEYFRPSA